MKICKVFFLVLFLMNSHVMAKNSIDKKIKKTSSKLSSYDSKYSNISSKMKKIAIEIDKQKRVIKKQNRVLVKLEKELQRKEKDFKENIFSLKGLEKSKKSLLSEENRLEQKLLFSIARNLSLDMMLEDERAHNAEALINAEVLKLLQEKTKKEIKLLGSKLESQYRQLTVLEKRSKKLQNQINAIDAKKSEISSLKMKNITSLKKLNSDKRKYKKELQHLIKEKKEIQRLLSKLHIIKQENIKKEQERKRKEAQRERNKKSKKLNNQNLPNVKKVGSSYQKAKTKKYRGKKTIAPLDMYKVIKRYGTYTDPIYKIKIFNESVSLKPLRGKNKVKNILNGKVVLAKKTALLKNLIIIEHKNGMHTIYAHLDKIAPGIKKGKRIKKGAIIGRVNNELMFEVTQKNFHIDPLQLIK